MHWLLHFVLVSVFIELCATEVLDLGDLEQYKPKLTEVPKDIHANGVWIGRNDTGYHIAFGPEVQTTIQSTFRNCGTDINNQCYQNFNKIFETVTIQFDTTIERRGFASLISKTFKKRILFLMAIYAYLLGNWKLKSFDNKESGMWLPDVKATEAGTLASATEVIISAQSSVVVTITQVADITTLRGSAIPSVTAVATSSEEFIVGDLAALLDKDLASRIETILRIVVGCKDGADFDAKHPVSSRKRVGGTYGQAICGAEAVLVNTQGPLSDLLLINTAELPFGFADTAGIALDAANVFADFVNAYAPMLAADPAHIQQIGVLIFLLSYDAFITNFKVKEKNRLASSMIKTSSTTTSGCPEPTLLNCGMTGEDCPQKDPAAGKTQPTCKSGQHKDCECRAPPITYLFLVSPAQQLAMISSFDLLRSLVHKPQCSKTMISVPKDVFKSQSSNIYGAFCSGLKLDKTSLVTLDSTGKNRNQKRAGTTHDPTVYSDWNFEIGFTPSKIATICQVSCNEAFEQLANACSYSNGGDFMYEKGTFDVGCGTYQFGVSNPTTALVAFPQFCYQKTDFAPLVKNGVDEYFLSKYFDFACTGGTAPIKRGDKSTFRQGQTTRNDVPYQYSIWWKEGCLLPKGVTEMSAANPLNLPASQVGWTFCQTTMKQNWRNCNNGGVGGNIQLGCLMYEFKADKNLRVF